MAEKGFFTGAEQGLKLAIPLVLEKQRMDAAESRFQQTLAVQKAGLLQKATQAQDTIKTNILSGAFKDALSRGDLPVAQKILPEINAVGGTNLTLPTSLIGKPEKNKINDFATFYRGFQSQHPELQSGELDKAASQAWFDRRVAEAKATGEGRGQGYAKARTVSVIDTKNDNRPVTISAFDVIKGNKDEPGRYLTGSLSEKALNKTALIEDIRGTSGNVRTSLQRMPDFTATQRAQIALVMKQRNLTSAMSQFLAGTWGQTLTPDQQDYLIDLAQLKENAMAMRSVLGAGQGSDELRSAITATIPGPSTPNKQYALKQLDKFDQVLNRLERGIVKVPLRKKEAGKDYGASTASDTGSQSSGNMQLDADALIKKYRKK